MRIAELGIGDWGFCLPAIASRSGEAGGDCGFWIGECKFDEFVKNQK
jgi:hypothetical protein